MRVGPVIAVADLDRAREFYEGKLGLAGIMRGAGLPLSGHRGGLIEMV